MSSVGKNMEQLDSKILLLGMLKDLTTLKNCLAVLEKVKHTPTMNPAIPLLGIYLREMKAYVHTKPIHECL